MFSKPNLKPYGRITEWRSGLALVNFSARVISSPALCRSEPGECLRIWSMLFNQNFQFSIYKFKFKFKFLSMFRGNPEGRVALRCLMRSPFGPHGTGRHRRERQRKAEAELSVQTILARHPLIGVFFFFDLLYSDIRTWFQAFQCQVAQIKNKNIKKNLANGVRHHLISF